MKTNTPGQMAERTGGRTLRSFRISANKTQRDVARALDVTTSAVSQWELDQTVPERPKAVMLDQFLGAEGAVAAAFGYTVVGRPKSATSRELATLIAHIEALGDRVAELEARERSRRAGAPGG